MKGMFKKFAALAAVVLFWSSQANAVLIEIVPDTTTGDPTDPVNVEIWATDLGGEYITAYDILVAFDETVLQFINYTMGSGLGWYAFETLDGPAVGNDPANGFAGVAELSFFGDTDFSLYQDGSDFMLFTLHFNAIAEFEALDFAFVWGDFNDVKCTNNVPCYPVPEPGTLALLGLGLLGMAISRRRQKI